MTKIFSTGALKYWPKIFRSIHSIIYLGLLLFVSYTVFDRGYPFEDTNSQKSLLISSLFILILAFALIRITKYSTIEDGEFVQYNPLSLQKFSIPLNEIAEIKTNFINTMYGTSKGVYIELKDGESLHLGSHMNSKKEINNLAQSVL